VTRTAQEQQTVNSLLVEAVEAYDLPRMQSYVGIGADVHVKVNTIERIRTNGSNCTTSGHSPLYHHMFGTYFRETVSDYMLSQGVDVDVKNHKGNTPLMLSVKSGDFNRVKYLLSKGASPLATNNQNEMVLEEARKLDKDFNPDRQRIVDALVAAVGAPVAPVAKPAAQTPTDQALSETKDDITVMKPLSVGPKKPGGGGLNL
jgi:Ankyrin repeats (3 copies)